MPEKTIDDSQKLTTSLMLRDATKAIDLYKKAFGAKEESRFEYPNSNRIMHAAINIKGVRIFIADVAEEMPDCEPSVVSFYLYTDDVDSSFKKATDAGLGELHPVKDMFWGDRTGSVKDEFGITWALATHVRDVSQEEMEEGRKNFGKEAA